MPTATDREVRVLDGSTFFVSDPLGDAHGTSAHGLFYRDTRFVSVATLQVNGQRPALLSTDEIDYFSASFFMTLPFDTAFASHPLTVIRNRFVGHGAHDEVIVTNFSDRPVHVTVQLTFDCDFADLFDVKAGRAAHTVPTLAVDERGHRLVFDYQVGTIHRQTRITFSEPPRFDGRAATFDVAIPAKGSWKTCIAIALVWDEVVVHPKYACNAFGHAKSEMNGTLATWQAQLPILHSDSDDLNHTFARSVVDLAALRFYPEEGDPPVLAAGLPWFMALFGRDNLITAYQSCYAIPDIAVCALQTLARRQGGRLDDFRDEQPSKILHEQRFGERTLLGEIPHSPYYGSADATPLFLIVLHELYRWTGDPSLAIEMKAAALRALAWIDQYGDADGDGYVEYRKRSPQGLDNQGWKDSWNSILFSDGRLAAPPIAAVEIQGYIHDAKCRLAELAEEVWGEPDLADELRRQATDLKRRFNRDFWIPARGGYFALALDGDKRQVDALTSNMGHLLWSGIVDGDKAERVVRELMAEPLYSGWGIRTMSTLDAGFNPIEYHNGTVWPHDNSLIAAGLVRYGFRDAANRIIADQLTASRFFEYRLPEVFAGYQRSSIAFPVEYPTASSPQAWATAAPLLFVRLMLGLRPDPAVGIVQADPLLPPGIGYVRLANLQLFGNRFTIDSRERTAPKSRLWRALRDRLCGRPWPSPSGP